MTRHELKRRYFKWLCGLVYDPNTSTKYDILLNELHKVPFRYHLAMDANRESDGLNLRYRFAIHNGLDHEEVEEELSDIPCSVLEVLVALSDRVEQIMEDMDMGDRTGLWFWTMIVNLGLGHHTDSNFDYDSFIYIIDRFLDREYESNGEGGLVTLRYSEDDLRDVEIWCQIMWYLNEVIEEER